MKDILDKDLIKFSKAKLWCVFYEGFYLKVYILLKYETRNPIF